jgi:hypothetical protein
VTTDNKCYAYNLFLDWQKKIDTSLVSTKNRHGDVNVSASILLIPRYQAIPDVSKWGNGEPPWPPALLKERQPGRRRKY